MGPQEVKLQKLRQIYQALLRLLQKKELIEITIAELCRTAQVSRTYYYRNFHSLQDVILTYKSWEMSAYLRRAHHAEEMSFNELMTVYFQLQKKEATSVAMLANAGLTETLVTTFESVYAYLIEQGKVEKMRLKNNYTTIFMAGAVVAVQLRWIQTGMKETPQQMGHILAALFHINS